MRTECSPTEFLKIAAHTAEHFGFKTVEALRKDPECKNCTTSLPHTIEAADSKLDAAQGLLTRGITQYCDERLHAGARRLGRARRCARGGGGGERGVRFRRAGTLRRGFAERDPRDVPGRRGGAGSVGRGAGK